MFPQVEEIYDLDPASFADLAPVYGLVFLFKWKQVTQEGEREGGRERECKGGRKSRMKRGERGGEGGGRGKSLSLSGL